MENKGCSGRDQSVQWRGDASSSSVPQHGISFQGIDTADGTQPLPQQQSVIPATAQGKRNADEITDPKLAKKRQIDKASKEKKKAMQEQIKSDRDELQAENLRLKLEYNPLMRSLEILKDQNEQLRLGKQEKDELMKSYMETLKAENEQLKIQIREKETQLSVAKEERFNALLAKEKSESENNLLRIQLEKAQLQILQLRQSTEPAQLQNQYGNSMQIPLQRSWGWRAKLERCSLSSLRAGVTFLSSNISSLIMFPLKKTLRKMGEDRRLALPTETLRTMRNVRGDLNLVVVGDYLVFVRIRSLQSNSQAVLAVPRRIPIRALRFLLQNLNILFLI
ncbi:hypothetical protein SLE2022_342110 [Rubroshorea leprosula]